MVEPIPTMLRRTRRPTASCALAAQVAHPAQISVKIASAGIFEQLTWEKPTRLSPHLIPVDRVTIPEAIGFQLGGEDLDILAQRAPVSFEHGNVIGLLVKSTYWFGRVLSGALS